MIVFASAIVGGVRGKLILLNLNYYTVTHFVNVWNDYSFFYFWLEHSLSLLYIIKKKTYYVFFIVVIFLSQPHDSYLA